MIVLSRPPRQNMDTKRRSLASRVAGRIHRTYRIGAKIMRALLIKASGSTAHGHWASLYNHDVAWEARTEALASMIVPNSVVLEFGAGRRALENKLPPNCRYIPSDLVSRGPETIV